VLEVLLRKQNEMPPDCSANKKLISRLVLKAKRLSPDCSEAKRLSPDCSEAKRLSPDCSESRKEFLKIFLQKQANPEISFTDKQKTL